MAFFQNFYGNALFIGLVGAMVLVTLMIFFRLFFKSTLQLSESFGKYILGKRTPKENAANFGTALHLTAHTIFGFLYGLIMPLTEIGYGALSGIIWGISMWFILNLIALPLIGKGIFGLKISKKIPLVSLFYYFVFGMTIGWLFLL